MIKHIIFDFGGVLLNLDYHKTFVELSDLMGIDLTMDTMPAAFKEIYLQFERGELKPETFMWNIQKLSPKPITEPHKIIRAWNAMLLGWNPDRLPWLLKLKETYHTYLLSNTNALHIDWVRKDLLKNHRVEDFESLYFDCVCYSHVVGMQKPNKDIYRHIIESNSIKPNEALFIDDNVENTEAATSVGLNAQVHDPSTEIMEMLPIYLEKFT